MSAPFGNEINRYTATFCKKQMYDDKTGLIMCYKLVQ